MSLLEEYADYTTSETASLRASLHSSQSSCEPGPSSCGSAPHSRRWRRRRRGERCAHTSTDGSAERSSLSSGETRSVSTSRSASSHLSAGSNSTAVSSQTVSSTTGGSRSAPSTEGRRRHSGGTAGSGRSGTQTSCERTQMATTAPLPRLRRDTGSGDDSLSSAPSRRTASASSRMRPGSDLSDKSASNNTSKDLHTTGHARRSSRRRRQRGSGASGYSEKSGRSYSNIGSERSSMSATAPLPAADAWSDGSSGDESSERIAGAASLRSRSASSQRTRSDTSTVASSQTESSTQLSRESTGGSRSSSVRSKSGTTSGCTDPTSPQSRSHSEHSTSACSGYNTGESPGTRDTEYTRSTAEKNGDRRSNGGYSASTSGYSNSNAEYTDSNSVYSDSNGDYTSNGTGYTGSNSGYSDNNSDYTSSGTGYTGSNTGRSGSYKSCSSTEYTDFASDGAEIRSMAYLLKRIAEAAALDDSQRRTDMSIVQSARKIFNLPYEPLTMKEEALRIARHLEWNIVIDEDRAAAVEKVEAYEKAKRVAVKQALRKLRALMVKQDQQKHERLQMEILESTDSAKKKAEAIAAISAASKLPGRMKEIPTSPRAILATARERLAMPSKNVHRLKFEALLQEAQQVCFSYGITLQLPESPRSEGRSTPRSASASDDGASVAQSSTVASTTNSMTLARNKLQDRIDGAIGSSNLDVIRGVLYDAKHFDGELGYARPLEHLRNYARDLGLSSSESESDDGSSTFMDSDSSDDDEEDDEENQKGAQSPAVESVGETSPKEVVGPKGLDNISKAYDREVAALASILTYVQGTAREQKDPAKTLRKCLLIVLRSEYEFDQLKQRGLRPVAMGSMSVHGTEDRTRTTWVMALRGVKFYCGVETKAELQKMLNQIEAAYRIQAIRKETIKAQKKEILSVKQYPRFQRAMVDLLQLPEFPDEPEFRMGLRKSVEATLTDIYSQPHPNPARFDALLVDATDTVSDALRKVHSTFVESKHRHAATKTEQFASALSELMQQLPTTGSIEDDNKNEEKIKKQLRLAVIDSDPKRFGELVDNVAPVVREALEKARDAFIAALNVIQADAQRRKLNAGWLDSLWKGITPDKEEDDATTRELRRIKKALARGRRGAMVDKQAIAEEEEARRLAAEREDDTIGITEPSTAKTMVTLKEAYELISAKLNIYSSSAPLSPTVIIQKARDRLALPVIELTDENIENETRMVCLGLGIHIEDEDDRERKKAQRYKAGRGRRAAMQTISMIQKGTKWQAGGMAASDGKVWWCSSCNYKNAPRWRCSMCGHRNNEMATQATPAIYSNRAHTEPSAERRALTSMQELVSTAKARADAARRSAEEEQVAAQAKAQAAMAQEEMRIREAALAAEREAAAHQDWVTKAAKRSASALADAARREEERRKALAERVRRVMEEDLEINRERRRKQLQRLEKKLVLRANTNDAVAATAPQLGVFNEATVTGTLVPVNSTAATFLPGETTSMAHSETTKDAHPSLADSALGPGAGTGVFSGETADKHATVSFLTTMQMKEEIAGLNDLAGGYEAEARKAQALTAVENNTQSPHSDGGPQQYVLADVHDPLGLQLATIRKLQQRSRPTDMSKRQQVHADARQDTPEDVRFMRTTLSLEPLVQRIANAELPFPKDDGRRGRGSSPRKWQDSKPMRAGSSARATSHTRAALDPYSAMTKENRRLLQKRARRHGHLHTTYNVHDRQGLTLHMTV